MISTWLSTALARRNIHYGWAMVAVTFLTALISAGTVGAPGVFIVPLQNEFGWSTAEISSALSIRFILFGLMAPFALPCTIVSECATSRAWRCWWCFRW